MGLGEELLLGRGEEQMGPVGAPQVGDKDGDGGVGDFLLAPHRPIKANGRGHTGEEVRRAAWRIREAGFSLGLQMMTGLYKSSPELDWGTGLGLADGAPDESPGCPGPQKDCH